MELDEHSQEYISLDEVDPGCFNLFMRATQAGLEEYRSTGKTAWGASHDPARVAANASEWHEFTRKLFAAKFQTDLGLRVSLVDPLEPEAVRSRPDFEIVQGPGTGKVLNFMFTPETEDAENMNRQLIRTPRHVEILRDLIRAHLVSADIVALNLKSLTAENQKRVDEEVVASFPPDVKERISIMR